MIEQQIRTWNVYDGQTLDVGRVRREEFVPLAYRSLAFMDFEIPLRGNAERLCARANACWHPRWRRACCRTCCLGPTTACSKSAPDQATWRPCWRNWPTRW
jgi:hypothetical protein